MSRSYVRKISTQYLFDSKFWWFFISQYTALAMSGLCVCLSKLGLHDIRDVLLRSPSEKYVREMYTPLNLFLYSKTGVCRGIPIFSYFCSKAKIVGTCKNPLDEAVLTCTHNLCFEKKIRKNINKHSAEIFQFLQLKNLCILHGRVFIMPIATFI